MPNWGRYHLEFERQMEEYERMIEQQYYEDTMRAEAMAKDAEEREKYPLFYWKEQIR